MTPRVRRDSFQILIHNIWSYLKVQGRDLLLELLAESYEALIGVLFKAGDALEKHVPKDAGGNRPVEIEEILRTVQAVKEKEEAREARRLREDES